MALKSRCPVALVMASFYPGMTWSIEPQAIDVYGFDFTPSFIFSESYDDNFRELEDRKQSSLITKLAPSFELKAEDRNSATRLIWQPTRYIYHDESDASNTAQRVRADSIMEFTDRHRLKLEAEYRKYERTESTAVEGVNDKINNKRVGGLYTFGAKSADNQIELGANYAQLRYDNADGINDDKERDTTAVTGTWYHRIGSNTRGLLEYDHTDFDYQQANSPRSSKSDAVLAGAVWDFTARTTGKVRVGYEKELRQQRIQRPRQPHLASRFAMETADVFDVYLCCSPGTCRRRRWCGGRKVDVHPSRMATRLDRTNHHRGASRTRSVCLRRTKSHR